MRYLLGIFLFSYQAVFACTDFVLKDAMQQVVNGRSMDFPIDLHSKIFVYPKGFTFQSKVFDGKEGLKWTTKYGYLGINAFDTNILCDGFNEKGLSIGALWFIGGQYPCITQDDLSHTIAFENVMDWILGNFDTVQAVKAALPNIHIWAHELPMFGGIPPLHVAIHDQMGNSLVVEFEGGEVKFYDNDVGVLTNAPNFPWHIKNLSNYFNLDPKTIQHKEIDSAKLFSYGGGNGLLGLPGNWTAASRFVRIAFLKNFARKAQTNAENINLAFHLLNTIDLPIGVMQNEEGFATDYTQWSIVKDLANKRLYYRLYGNLTIESVDLMPLLKANKFQVIPLQKP